MPEYPEERSSAERRRITDAFVELDGGGGDPVAQAS